MSEIEISNITKFVILSFITIFIIYNYLKKYLIFKKAIKLAIRNIEELNLLKHFLNLKKSTNAALAAQVKFYEGLLSFDEKTNKWKFKLESFSFDKLTTEIVTQDIIHEICIHKATSKKATLEYIDKQINFYKEDIYNICKCIL